MPFRSRRKRNYKRKPMVRRRRFVRRSFKSRMLKKMAVHRPEFKDFSFNYPSQISPGQTTASQIFAINLVPDILAAGANSSTSRIGREITGKSVHWDWLVQTTGNNYLPRIQAKFYFDIQPDGSTPSATDFKLTDIINSPRNLANADRFICLKTIEPRPITGNFSTANNAATFQSTGSFSLNNAVTRFNSTLTSGLGSVMSGVIWCVTYGTPDIVTVSGNSQFAIRYRFTDI